MTTPEPPSPPGVSASAPRLGGRVWWQGLWPLGAALVLLAVFALYLQPELLIAIDGLVFGCGG